MELTIRNKDKVLKLPVDNDMMLSLTPAKKSRGVDVYKTPSKDGSQVDSMGRPKRNPNLTNEDKIEVLGEFIREGFIKFSFQVLTLYLPLYWLIQNFKEAN